MISFDLKLRWPTASGTAEAGPSLVPYLALGPALLVSESPYAPLTRGETPGDYAVSLGLKGGAGLSWRLGAGASVFGEYGFTRAADEHRPGTGRAGDGLDTQGFRYGVQIKF